MADQVYFYHSLRAADTFTHHRPALHAADQKLRHQAAECQPEADFHLRKSVKSAAATQPAADSQLKAKQQQLLHPHQAAAARFPSSSAADVVEGTIYAFHRPEDTGAHLHHVAAPLAPQLQANAAMQRGVHFLPTQEELLKKKSELRPQRAPLDRGFTKLKPLEAAPAALNLKVCTCRNQGHHIHWAPHEGLQLQSAATPQDKLTLSQQQYQHQLFMDQQNVVLSQQQQWLQQHQKSLKPQQGLQAQDAAGKYHHGGQSVDATPARSPSDWQQPLLLPQRRSAPQSYGTATQSATSSKKTTPTSSKQVSPHRNLQQWSSETSKRTSPSRLQPFLFQADKGTRCTTCKLHSSVKASVERPQEAHHFLNAPKDGLDQFETQLYHPSKEELLQRKAKLHHLPAPVDHGFHPVKPLAQLGRTNSSKNARELARAQATAHLHAKSDAAAKAHQLEIEAAQAKRNNALLQQHEPTIHFHFSPEKTPGIAQFFAVPVHDLHLHHQDLHAADTHAVSHTSPLRGQAAKAVAPEPFRPSAAELQQQKCHLKHRAAPVDHNLIPLKKLASNAKTSAAAQCKTTTTGKRHQYLRRKQQNKAPVVHEEVHLFVRTATPVGVIEFIAVGHSETLKKKDSRQLRAQRPTPAQLALKLQKMEQMQHQSNIARGIKELHNGNVHVYFKVPSNKVSKKQQQWKRQASTEWLAGAPRTHHSKSYLIDHDRLPLQLEAAAGLNSKLHDTVKTAHSSKSRKERIAQKKQQLHADPMLELSPLKQRQLSSPHLQRSPLKKSIDIVHHRHLQQPQSRRQERQRQRQRQRGRKAHH